MNPPNLYKPSWLCVFRQRFYQDINEGARNKRQIQIFLERISYRADKARSNSCHPDIHWNNVDNWKKIFQMILLRAGVVKQRQIEQTKANVCPFCLKEKQSKWKKSESRASFCFWCSKKRQMSKRLLILPSNQLPICPFAGKSKANQKILELG